MRAQISIHALHEESDLSQLNGSLLCKISIHALHEESDPEHGYGDDTSLGISIHALHEESDVTGVVNAIMHGI